MANLDPVAADLISFLNAAPTAFHAVAEAKILLKQSGFSHLSERSDWDLQPGKKYFFTRNHSTIVAFAIGNRYVAGNGFHIVGAHTDSPCLKVKPVSKVVKAGCLEIGVQTYGGGLWHTWFDRDLAVAGRVIVKKVKDGKVVYEHKLVRVEEPIMRIPTLAIHLDRGVSDGFKVNTQSHLIPLLATSVKAELENVGEKDPAEIHNDGKATNEKTKDDNKNHHPLFLKLIAEKACCEPHEICDFELQICDTQPSIVGGAMKEFIFSGRLDNLCMSFCSLKALIDSTQPEGSLDGESGVRMVALFDHEEVGSNSAQGAGSPVMLDALSRITKAFDSSDSKGTQTKANIPSKKPVVAAKNVPAALSKKKQKSSDSSDSDSCSEEETETKTKAANASKKPTAVPVVASKKKQESSDSSDSDTSSEEEIETKSKAVMASKKPTIASKKPTAVPVVASKKKQESSDSSDSDTSSEEEIETKSKVVMASKKPTIEAKNGPAVVSKAKQESSDSSDSDASSEENETETKASIPAKKSATDAKIVPAVASKKKQESSDSSDSDSSSEEETETQAKANILSKKPATEAKNVQAVVPKKKQESSDSSDSSSEEETDTETKASTLSKKPATGAKNGPTVVSKKQESSSSSDSDTSSDDETETKPKANVVSKNIPTALTKKKQESSDSSDSDSSSEEETETETKATDASKKPATATKIAPVVASKKKQESSDSSDSDTSSEEENVSVKKQPVTGKRDLDKKPQKVAAAKEDESSDESSDESDEGPQRKKPKILSNEPTSKPSAKAIKKETSSDEDSSDESSDDSPKKTQQNKKDTDVDMVDAPSANANNKVAFSSEKKPYTPATQSQTSGSTLFIGNLPFKVGEDEVAEFFKEAGEVVGVRLAKDEDGFLKGFGHVEFATEEAAKKGLELDGYELLGRCVKLDMARPRPSYTPNTGTRGSFTPRGGRESNSYQKGDNDSSQTIFVRGFDTSHDEDQIRSSLKEHFGTCGEITRCSVPKDFETGASKGMAYIDFQDPGGVTSALELNGSDLGGWALQVEKARPRVDSGGSGGRFGGGSGRGERSGRGFDRGGRSSRGRGFDRGGRSGSGRGSARGGRGGTPVSTGKKITFGDD